MQLNLPMKVMLEYSYPVKGQMRTMLSLNTTSWIPVSVLRKKIWKNSLSASSRLILREIVLQRELVLALPYLKDLLKPWEAKLVLIPSTVRDQIFGLLFLKKLWMIRKTWLLKTPRIRGLCSQKKKLIALLYLWLRWIDLVSKRELYPILTNTRLFLVLGIISSLTIIFTMIV